VAELENLDMGDAPAGLVPEAPLACAADRFVANELGNNASESYFNAGVILVNAFEWRRRRVTERAMEYISRARPPFHDQSALNVVLRGAIVPLDERFNCIANMRTHWPALRQPLGNVGRLIHFLDYPKPWDWMAEWVHPQYRLWRSALDRTAITGFRSWRAAESRRLPNNRKAWTGYKKALKDRLLFAGYSHGWVANVKGVPQS
jgi:lipopolysaccharide biosynthesis glycosyltransferase